MSEPYDTLELWDYRRRVGEIYGALRAAAPDQAVWQRWCDGRDRLFANHPQSPLAAAQKVAFKGLNYFPFDPAWRFEAEVEPAAGEPAELGHNAAGSTPATLFGVARLFVGEQLVRLPLYWLNDYGGGVFVPFTDHTNGTATYGGGRYLLDTAKGADLGHVGTKIVLDFNYAYHPSCAHNPMWSCPLPPLASRIELAVRAGERLADA